MRRLRTGAGACPLCPPGGWRSSQSEVNSGMAQRSGTPRDSEAVPSNTGTAERPKSKRIEVVALVVSIVALIPSTWVFFGLPTFDSFFANRTAAEKYFSALEGVNSGRGLTQSERVTNALAYAAPESDAWLYATQRHWMWTAYEAGGGDELQRDNQVFTDGTSVRICKVENAESCVRVENMRFDQQHRLETFTENGVPLGSIMLKAKAEPFQDATKPGVKITFKGGERHPGTTSLQVAFEIWNDTEKKLILDPTVNFRAADETDEQSRLVGPTSIARGQRALYFARGPVRDAQWLHLLAANEGDETYLRYWLPIG